jgi:hypothetical protein
LGVLTVFRIYRDAPRRFIHQVVIVAGGAGTGSNPFLGKDHNALLGAESPAPAVPTR